MVRAPFAILAPPSSDGYRDAAPSGVTLRYEGTTRTLDNTNGGKDVQLVTVGADTEVSATHTFNNQHTSHVINPPKSGSMVSFPIGQGLNCVGCHAVHGGALGAAGIELTRNSRLSDHSLTPSGYPCSYTLAARPVKRPDRAGHSADTDRIVGQPLRRDPKPVQIAIGQQIDHRTAVQNADGKVRGRGRLQTGTGQLMSDDMSKVVTGRGRMVGQRDRH